MRLRAIALMAGLLSLAACRGNSGHHDHSSAHPSGHDHHAEGHGHGSTPTTVATAWNDSYEVFLERSEKKAGEAALLIHITELGTHEPYVSDAVDLRLGEQRITAAKVGPGVFSAQLGDAPTTGALALVLKKGRIAIPLETFAPLASDAGRIEFLKEQQWSVPFATDFVRSGVLTDSAVVSGRVQTPPGGQAVVSAPIPGRFEATAAKLPWPGTRVEAGTVLAQIQPTPSSPEAGVRASLAVAEAKARALAASTELERARRLLRDDAIAKREVEAAEREHTVAQEAVRSAARAQRLYSSTSKASRQGSWQLRAPISGTIASVHGTPGQAVTPGEALFDIVDASVLWILARVPEQDAARLRTDRDASYQLAGQRGWTTIDITGEDATASLVTIGNVVDPARRTVDVLYSLESPDPSLRVGGLVQVSVPAGDEFSGIVIPRTALVRRAGRDIVYVQIDGEHFEERGVEVLASSGADVGVRGNLEAGERIVTKGAHLVRLAESASGPPAHGHIH